MVSKTAHLMPLFGPPDALQLTADGHKLVLGRAACSRDGRIPEGVVQIRFEHGCWTCAKFSSSDHVVINGVAIEAVVPHDSEEILDRDVLAVEATPHFAHTALDAVRRSPWYAFVFRTIAPARTNQVGRSTSFAVLSLRHQDKVFELTAREGDAEIWVTERGVEKHAKQRDSFSTTAAGARGVAARIFRAQSLEPQYLIECLSDAGCFLNEKYVPAPDGPVWNFSSGDVLTLCTTKQEFRALPAFIMVEQWRLADAPSAESLFPELVSTHQGAAVVQFQATLSLEMHQSNLLMADSPQLARTVLDSDDEETLPLPGKPPAVIECTAPGFSGRGCQAMASDATLSAETMPLRGVVQTCSPLSSRSGIPTLQASTLFDQLFDDVDTDDTAVAAVPVPRTIRNERNCEPQTVARVSSLEARSLARPLRAEMRGRTRSPMTKSMPSCSG